MSPGEAIESGGTTKIGIRAVNEQFGLKGRSKLDVTNSVQLRTIPDDVNDVEDTLGGAFGNLCEAASARRLAQYAPRRANAAQARIW